MALYIGPEADVENRLAELLSVISSVVEIASVEIGQNRIVRHVECAAARHMLIALSGNRKLIWGSKAFKG